MPSERRSGSTATAAQWPWSSHRQSTTGLPPTGSTCFPQVPKAARCRAGRLASSCPRTPSSGQEELEALLLEGINSGPAEPIDWAEMRREVQKAHRRAPARARMSSRRIVQRRQARRDAIEQAAVIAADNPKAAGRFFEAIDQTLQLLAEMPGNGRGTGVPRPSSARPPHAPGAWVSQHLLFYLPFADGIELVRVLHGKRNIERLFRPEPRPKPKGRGSGSPARCTPLRRSLEPPPRQAAGKGRSLATQGFFDGCPHTRGQASRPTDPHSLSTSRAQLRPTT